MSNIINVCLYGDGSRDARRRAEYIHCDQAEECSAYKNGKCFCVTTLFSVRCGVGTVRTVDGGTKRSKAFHRVSREAKEHEKYAKLSYPINTYVTKIKEKVLLTIPCVWIEETEGGCLRCEDPHLKTNHLLTDAENLTPENIRTICGAKPRAIMGGVIQNYQEKYVPMFLHQLSNVFPEKYEAFLAAYPDYEIKPPDWRGEYAKLSTCNREKEYKDTHGNVFRFEEEYLVCENYKSMFAPFDGSGTEIRLLLTDSMKVKITDNEQVTSETVFV